MVPCKECLVLAMCYNNKYKVIECDLFKKYVNENIGERAMNIVREDPRQLGFHWFSTDHPIHDKFHLGINILAHSDKIYIKGIADITKV